MLMAAVLPRDTVVTYKPPRGAKVNLSTADHVTLADTGHVYPLKADLGPQDDPPRSIKARDDAARHIRVSLDDAPRHFKAPLVPNGSLPTPTAGRHPPLGEITRPYGSFCTLSHATSNGGVAGLARNALTRASTLRPTTTGVLKAPTCTGTITNNRAAQDSPPRAQWATGTLKPLTNTTNTRNTSTNTNTNTRATRDSPPRTPPPVSPSRASNSASPSRVSRPVSPARSFRLSSSRTNSSSTETLDSRPSSILSTNTDELTFSIPLEEDEEEEEEVDVRNLREEVEQWGRQNSQGEVEETRIGSVEAGERGKKVEWGKRNVRVEVEQQQQQQQRARNPRMVLLKSSSLNFTPMLVSQQPPLRDQHGCPRPTTPTTVNLQQRRAGPASDLARRANYRANKTVSFDCETRTETYETEMTESETDEREYVRLMTPYDRRPYVRLPVSHDEEYCPPGKEEQDFLPKMLCFALALVITGGILYGLNVIITRMNMNLFSA